MGFVGCRCVLRFFITLERGVGATEIYASFWVWEGGSCVYLDVRGN